MQQNDPFHKYREFQTSNLIQQRTVYATLLAIEEQLEKQNLQLTSSNYFIALFSTLSSEHHRNKISVGSLLRLLSTLLPKVPLRLMHNKHEEMISLCVTCLSTLSNDELIVRYSISCLGTLLSFKGCPWGQLNVVESYRLLLGFSLDSRSKVRKSSIHKLEAIWKKGNKKMAESCVQATKKFCFSIFEQAEESPSEIIRLMPFLNNVLPYFSLPLARSLIKVLLKTPKLKNNMIILQSLKAIRNWFMNCKLQLSKTDLPLIASLQSFEIPLTNASMILTLSSTIRSGITKIYSSISESNNNTSQLTRSAVTNSILPLLPKIFENFYGFLEKNNSMEIKFGLKKICEKILSSALTNQEFELNLTTDFIEFISNNCLNYKQRNSWDVSLHICQIIFKCFTNYSGNSNDNNILLKNNQTIPNCLVELIEKIKSLHDVDDVKISDKVEMVLTQALRSIKSNNFFKIIELPIDQFINQENRETIPEWIFTLITDGLDKGDELASFIDNVLKPIREMNKLQQKTINRNHKFEEKIITNLLTRLWLMFPSFCKSPIDLKTVFPKIAKELGLLLSSKTTSETIKDNICKGIEILIKSHKSNNLDMNLEGNQKEKQNNKNKGQGRQGQPILNLNENQKFLQKYAKNYLPILFNRFTKLNPSQRKATFDCIHTYSTIAPQDLMNRLFKKLLSKILEGTSSLNSTSLDVISKISLDDVSALAELSLAISQSLDKNNILLLLRTIIPHLKTSKTARIQKKFYKILSSIISYHYEIIESQLEDLLEIIYQTSKTCTPGAKCNRIITLGTIFKKIELTLLLEILPSMIPEIILSTKEGNYKTREQAYRTLTIITHRIALMNKNENEDENKSGMEKEQEQDEEEKENIQNNLANLCLLFSIGLAGKTSLMISAAAYSITHVIFDSDVKFEDKLIINNIEKVKLILNHDSKEVKKSSLFFFNKLISSEHKEMLLPFLKEIFQIIFSWTTNIKNHFKLFIQNFIQKCLNKYSETTIDKLFPKSHQKYLVHLKRQLRRKKNKRSKDQKQTKIKTEKNRKKKNKKFQLNVQSELDGGDPIDLLDKNALKRISFKNRGGDDEFDMDDEDILSFDQDGKIIIPEENNNNKSDLDSEFGEQSSLDRKRKKNNMNNNNEEKNKKKRRSLNSNSKKNSRKGKNKKKEQLEPYQYIQLDAKLSSKKSFRKGKFGDGGFKNLMNAAKRGAKKGKNLRKNKRK
ncbi:rrp12-like protein [Anaeramoeba flamelloides]|uniref:Rrp12-like protein n=1 Tax=Anaeramoeba flamelloides TaxID=1746091 RepID=A0ABQ8Y0R4_9EUKA|nr:rrp12-like protein [Anaeramoeba flamelloides]